jgi:putative sterol carrier protein
VATEEQCRVALEQLAGRLSQVDSDERRRVSLDRSVSCTLTDLGTTFSGELREGHIVDLTTDDAPRAQIRLTMTSDDLVALTEGDLDLAKSWLSGRVKIDASMMDLLKLRSML